MTTETFTPHTPDLIQGTGPYAVPHGYSRAADLIVSIRTISEALIILPSADWSVSPASSDQGGDVTLSTSAAAIYDGGELTVTRDTLVEQGWQGQGGAREEGLEKQLDIIARGVQDQRQVSRPMEGKGRNWRRCLCGPKRR